MYKQGYPGCGTAEWVVDLNYDLWAKKPYNEPFVPRSED